MLLVLVFRCIRRLATTARTSLEIQHKMPGNLANHMFIPRLICGLVDVPSTIRTRS